MPIAWLAEMLDITGDLDTAVVLTLGVTPKVDVDILQLADTAVAENVRIAVKRCVVLSIRDMEWPNEAEEREDTEQVIVRIARRCTARLDLVHMVARDILVPTAPRICTVRNTSSRCSIPITMGN